jgi:long-chain acyl-CoA synthetase
MSVETINEVFYKVVERNHDRVMLFKQTVKWIPIASHELYRDAVGVSHQLQQWGVQKGDRVAILSENRPEWTVAEFGTVLIGGVVVPIYPTLTPEQTAYMLRDSGARILFCSTVDQLKKVQAIKQQTALEKVVVMDYIGITDGIPMHRLMHVGPTKREAEFDAQARALGPDDLATIMYTSGTTGTSKGVMLTHGNLASNVVQSLAGFPVAASDVHISFLPLSHITARHVDYAMLYHGVTIAYCPWIDELSEVLLEVRPTLFVAVPRVYEKIMSRAAREAKKGMRLSILRWALRVGQTHREEILAGRTPASRDWKLANRLVYSRIRQGLGGRVKIFISGGAPLNRQTAEWFADMGIRIHEGYGLTETSPVIAVNTPTAHRLGTVGRPLPNVEVKIAEDGEILVQGPSVFQGYWNLPEETHNAFVDGWFKTGDVGKLDEDGFLSVTDRKKDLIKTSGGKFIAPQPIEAKLKANPLVAEAVVIGDKQKFPAVVIAPNFSELEPRVREQGLSFASREEMVKDARVRAMYESIVAALNQDLAQFEKLKKTLLVAEEPSVANGTLTPTLKLKRRAVEEKYRGRIQQMYSEPAGQLEETVASG